VTYDAEHHRIAREVTAGSPVEQAERVREIWSDDMDPELTQTIMRHVTSRGMEQAKTEAGRARMAWARATDWVVNGYSRGFTRTFGRMDPSQPVWRQRIKLAAYGLATPLEGPMTRILVRSREIQAEHTREFYKQLGDLAEPFAQKVREGDAQKVEPYAGRIVRQDDPATVQAHFRQGDDGPLGKIDGNILPLVASLNAWGVTTTQSCEGHTDRAVPAPWVMFDRADAPKVQRLLDEVGAGDWVISRMGGARLTPAGSAPDHSLLLDSERERIDQIVLDGQRKARALSSRLDALPAQLDATVELESMGRAASLETGHELRPDAGDLGV
jgi:hypothetical protein